MLAEVLVGQRVVVNVSEVGGWWSCGKQVVVVEVVEASK
jgi:hypothetical protein